MSSISMTRQMLQEQQVRRAKRRLWSGITFSQQPTPETCVCAVLMDIRDVGQVPLADLADDPSTLLQILASWTVPTNHFCKVCSASEL